MKNSRDFVVAVYIVYKKKTLLHLHKKFGVWLPVGGHIDQNELPDEAALREVKEEAGIPIKFYSRQKKFTLGKEVTELLCPMHVQLEDIKPGHQHIDLIYYATTKVGTFNPEEGEATDLRWFTLEELKKLKNAPPNAIKYALEALTLLTK